MKQSNHIQGFAEVVTRLGTVCVNRKLEYEEDLAKTKATTDLSKLLQPPNEQ